MRLIDADEVLKRWGLKYYAMGGDRLGPNGDDVSFYVNGLLNEIQNAPTVVATEDCISRERAINAISKGSGCGNVCRKALETIPSVQFTEGPQGEWIDHSEDEGYVECPICNSLTNCNGNIDELHYCWHCGAYMMKEAENEHIIPL